jgi:hypothetical protein
MAPCDYISRCLAQGRRRPTTASCHPPARPANFKSEPLYVEVRILVLYHVRPGRRIWIDCFVGPSSKAGQPVEHQSVVIPSIFRNEFQ